MRAKCLAVWSCSGGSLQADLVRIILPKGNTITQLRDCFGAVYSDDQFQALYPTRGQPAYAPWRLALVTVFQFLEHLSDRQATSFRG